MGDRLADRRDEADAAHFQRIGAAPSEAAVAAQDPDSLNAALAAFDDALNETVVRAVTSQTAVSAYLELLVAASPAWRRDVEGVGRPIASQMSRKRP